MKPHSPFRVLILLNHALKAARDEISGILRGASSHPELEIRILDRGITPSALRDRINAWIPNGIITDNRGSVPALLPAGKKNCITFEDSQTHHIPIVYLDFICSTAFSVSVDNVAIGECAAKFFLKRNYEHFAFVGTNLGHTSSHAQERAVSFAKVVNANGFSCSNFLIDENCSDNWTRELERLARWIESLPKPCALLTHADLYAQRVTDACRLAKVNIPEQIALLGVDNEIDITDNLRPTLSSILPDFEKAGLLAIKTLHALMTAKHRPLKPLHITYGIRSLIERESTQDTHGAGRLVDLARSIIRKRSLEGIRVADIARELNVSNRLLEMNFKAVLGHSARDELINYRLEEVKRRLATTNGPIESIALQCGWRSSLALKLLFKKRFKMSMRDFRKQMREMR